MIAEQGFYLSEMNRRLMQILRVGLIKEVDVKNAKAKVKIGDNITGWRPWVSLAKAWAPPSVGEQVVVLSPNGDFEQSILLLSVYHSKFKAPSDKENEIKFEFSKENSLTFDEKKDTLTLNLSEEGVFEIALADVWAIFEKESFAFKNQNSEFFMDPTLMRLKNGTKSLEITENNVQIRGPLSSLSLQNDTITMQVGPQTLELNATGLFLNNLPITPGL